MAVRLDYARPGVTRRGSGYRRKVWRLLPRAVLVGGALLFSASLGCVNPSLRSEAVDVVQNVDLVRSCSFINEGTYTALGEKNALTLARNATVRNGGNVFFLVSVDKSETLTTTVNGKIYACKR